MRGHVGKMHCSGRLHQDRRAPPGCLVGVTPEVRAEARGADEISDGVPRVFRMSEVEGARHGLKREGVVANV